MRNIVAFYAWQSDTPRKINKDFIRKALDDAAERINADRGLGVELKIDSDTQDVPGTPPVTATILALETGSRFNTVRTLQWLNISFTNRCLRFGKDKTPSGTGRTVPLNPRALETLKFLAQQFPNRLSEHYVFPLEKCSRSGTEGSFGFCGEIIYETDPSKPIGDIKEAWEGAKKRTRRHCPQCAMAFLQTSRSQPRVTCAIHASWKPQNCQRAWSRFAFTISGIPQ